MDMARPLRIEFPGALYHIMIRGNEGGTLFKDAHDYGAFCKRLQTAVELFSLECYAYCLLPNHYHLFLCTPDANLSKAMQWLGTAYTVWFNRRHQRYGHLFQGRYKALLVEGDAYFWEVSRYIHLNPVRAGLVEDCVDWLWSSYPGYCHKSKQEAYVTYDRILNMTGGTRSQARRAYRRYVTRGIREELPDPFQEAWNGIVLGGKGFIERIIRMVRDYPARYERDVPGLKTMKRHYDIKTIQEAVAAEADIQLKDLSTARYRVFLHPRMVGTYLCRMLTRATAREIAKAFGLRSDNNVSV